MREAVILTRPVIKKPDGRKYPYWVLRWYSSAGRRRTQCIGRADRMSKRQAEKLRRNKQAELDGKPERRNVTQSPVMAAFLDTYYRARQGDLAPGTLELHQ